MRLVSSSHGTAPSHARVNRTVVLRYRIYLEQRRHAPAPINLRLAAVHRSGYEAEDAGLLSPELAAGIRRVKGLRRLRVRLGNWLTPEQGRGLLAHAEPATHYASSATAPCLPCSSAADCVAASCWRSRWSQSSSGRSTGASPISPRRLATSGRCRSHSGSGPLSMTRRQPPPYPAAPSSARSTSRPNLGRRNVTAGAVGCPGGSGARRDRKAGAHDLRRTCARLCHLAVANSNRSGSSWATSLSRPRDGTSDASRSPDAR